MEKVSLGVESMERGSLVERGSLASFGSGGTSDSDTRVEKVGANSLK